MRLMETCAPIGAARRHTERLDREQERDRRGDDAGEQMRLHPFAPPDHCTSAEVQVRQPDVAPSVGVPVVRDDLATVRVVERIHIPDGLCLPALTRAARGVFNEAVPVTD